jgi:hypothetical protein
MKLFGKLLIVALILAGLLPFTFLKGKDGRPLMSFDQLKLPEFGVPDLPDSIDLPAAGGNDGTTDNLVYKWRDAEGVLQFSTQPPPPGIEFSVKGYDPNTNLIQSVKPEQVPVTEAAAVVRQPQTQTEVDIGNPYSPDNVKKLINDAKQVQELINQRYQQQEALIGK